MQYFQYDKVECNCFMGNEQQQIEVQNSVDE